MPSKKMSSEDSGIDKNVFGCEQQQQANRNWANAIKIKLWI